MHRLAFVLVIVTLALVSVGCEDIEDWMLGNDPPRAFLGLNVGNLERGTSLYARTGAEYGVVVVRNLDRLGLGDWSPALNAGLRFDDVIVQVGSMRIRNESEFARAVRQLEPGSQVTLSVYRGFDLLTVPVVSGIWWAEDRVMSRIGVWTRSVIGDDVDRLSLSNRNGVIIEEVSGTALLAGLKVNDVIIRVGDNVINSSNDLSMIVLQSRPGRTIPVTFIRNGQERTVRVEIGSTRIWWRY